MAMRINKVTNLAEIFDKKLRSLTNKKRVMLALIIYHWKDIVGKNFYQYCFPKKVSKHTLYIESVSPIFSSQIRYAKASILERLPKIIGHGQVNELKIEVVPNSIQIEDVEQEELATFDPVKFTPFVEGTEPELKNSLLNLAKTIKR